ncbi:hypothetical protein Pmani_029764 [Petrolisthes manimaculis]|uniref:Uncharacterized protein n=1 Tax=Petrolisthes manimaculis TaxID=1843537 RepID=A0AAE1NY47_9EUCA|nr:hypothetical protein Pmani_029764 [Petrolisthes manimaculis]
MQFRPALRSHPGQLILHFDVYDIKTWSHQDQAEVSPSDPRGKLKNGTHSSLPPQSRLLQLFLLSSFNSSSFPPSTLPPFLLQLFLFSSTISHSFPPQSFLLQFFFLSSFNSSFFRPPPPPLHHSLDLNPIPYSTFLRFPHLMPPLHHLSPLHSTTCLHYTPPPVSTTLHPLSPLHSTSHSLSSYLKS